MAELHQQEHPFLVAFIEIPESSPGPAEFQDGVRCGFPAYFFVVGRGIRGRSPPVGELHAAGLVAVVTAAADKTKAMPTARTATRKGKLLTDLYGMVTLNRARG